MGCSVKTGSFGNGGGSAGISGYTKVFESSVTASTTSTTFAFPTTNMQWKSNQPYLIEVYPFFKVKDTQELYRFLTVAVGKEQTMYDSLVVYVQRINEDGTPSFARKDNAGYAHILSFTGGESLEIVLDFNAFKQGMSYAFRIYEISFPN